MKILLDQCVPAPLARLLVGHLTKTAMKLAWDELRNGELLRLAEAQFDLFITADQNLRYQQNLQNARIAILDLSTNNWRRIQSAASELRDVVETIRAGEHRYLEIP